MFTIRRILHPTDFSPPARAALRTACGLAVDYGAELTLLHVWDPLVAAGEKPHPHLPTSSLEEALAWLDAVEVPGPSIQSYRHLVVGNPVNEILMEAKESAADLIVMGTHGRKGLSRLLMGSVAEGVSRLAPCPVMTVREAPSAGQTAPVAPEAEMACV